MDMRVACGNVRIDMPQRFLHDTDVARLMIEIRSAAVPEGMAGMSGIFQPCLLQRLVHHKPQAVSCNALSVGAVAEADDGGGCSPLAQDRAG